MERVVYQSLIDWKNQAGRKPLILRGARQVGKTWLMKEFGTREYQKIVYVNFEKSKSLRSLFLPDFDHERILTAIRVDTGIDPRDPDTLIVLDEIQEAEGAITSLKYFFENAPSLHIIAAGSLLGISLHAHTSFPVGKVSFLDIHPMSFKEFLLALDQKPLVDLLEAGDWELIKTFREKYIQLLKIFYLTGGMPEVILSFLADNDFTAVRNIQNNLLAGYEKDFSKHAPHEIVPRINMLWNSIPSQLARENKKFIYGAVKHGSRAKDYELALSWLIECGLVHKVSRVTKPHLPLKAYEDQAAFKLFINDVGLLAAMGDLDPKTILQGNTIFTEFKGSLTEQFVLQEFLHFQNSPIFYWSSEKSLAELDFLLQIAGKTIPVEVKAEENLKAKSLKSFHLKYSPARSYRISISDFREESWITNLPLYSVSELISLVNI
jgi:predicted AAA+ superfamily ATPase